MEKIHFGKGGYLLEQLSLRYRIRENDIGEDAHLSKNGFVFDIHTFEINEIGHLCIMNMKAMLGLMQMETVVLSSINKDMPLMNMDQVKVMGKQTLIGELYDTQLSPWPEEQKTSFFEITEKDHDLPDYDPGIKHWYDDIMYPCSYHKTGRGIALRLDRSADDFISAFVSGLEDAPECDEEEKKAKVEAFAKKLSESGGSAVKQFTKLFGRETAERIIMHHMYGV